MKGLTDAQVEKEIERLKKSKAVQLSKLEQKTKYKRRQILYTLRWHEKHGKELEASGVTEEMLKSMNDDLEQE